MWQPVSLAIEWVLGGICGTSHNIRRLCRSRPDIKHIAVARYRKPNVVDISSANVFVGSRLTSALNTDQFPRSDRLTLTITHSTSAPQIQRLVLRCHHAAPPRRRCNEIYNCLFTFPDSRGRKYSLRRRLLLCLKRVVRCLRTGGRARWMFNVQPERLTGRPCRWLNDKDPPPAFCRTRWFIKRLFARCLSVVCPIPAARWPVLFIGVSRSSAT